MIDSKNMKRTDQKSLCPINFTLEIIGNSWSILILRDLMVSGKRTFGEFTNSEERISTVALTQRLNDLEKNQIISAQADPKDKRKIVYSLTEKGIDMLPIVYEIAIWGSNYCPHPDVPDSWFKSMKYDRAVVLGLWRESLLSGSSFFNGPDSVVKKLSL